jgi:hypothetical protein
MSPNSASPLRDSPDALLLRRTRLFTSYGIHVDGSWNGESLQTLEEAAFLFFGLAPDDFQLWHWVENLSVKLEQIPAGGLTSRNLVRLNPNHLTLWTVIHELAHAWDASQGWKISSRMAKDTGSRFEHPILHRLHPADIEYWYAVGSPPPPCGVDANFNRLEDFAESVTAYLFPEEAAKKAEERGWGYQAFGFHHFHETPRGVWIARLFHHS